MIIVVSLNFGTPKMINFPFGKNGKLTIVSVPILKHIEGDICIKLEIRTLVCTISIPNLIIKVHYRSINP